MASPLMTKASIYGSDSDGASETVAAAASGGTMETTEPANSPIKAILFMLGALIGIRVLWEAAKEIT